MKPHINATFLFALVINISSANAQCSLEQSVNSCLGAVDLNSTNAELKQFSIDREEKRLALTNTGTADSESLSDFVSKLKLGFDSVNFGQNDVQGLSLDWNGVIKDLLVSTFFDEDDVWSFANSNHKLSIKVNEAQVFSPLKELLSEQQRSSLSAEVDDYDDVSYSFSWSPISEKSGRRFSAHNKVFNEVIWKKFEDDIQSIATISNGYIALLQPVIKSFFKNGVDIQQAFNTNEIYDVDLGLLIAECNKYQNCPTENIKSIIPIIEAASLLTVEVKNSITTQLNTTTIAAWRKLIGNQPQWVLTGEHRERGELSGADENGIKLAYEWSRYNINQLRSSKVNCEQDIKCIESFIEKYSEKIDAGARISFSLEYMKKDNFLFNRPGLPQMQINDESSLIAYSSFSRSINSKKLFGLVDMLGENSGRFEFTLSYEDVQDDPLRNDRFIVNAAFTQEVSQGAVFTVGFVYANKPEYLGVVDKEISARFGVNYKFGKLGAQ